MIIGVDVGGSTTKAVAITDKVEAYLTVATVDPLASAIGALGALLTKMSKEMADIEAIALTGGKSRILPERILGIEAFKVGELEAVGIGGLYMTGFSEALVVSMGTGVAIVEVRENGEKIKHVGGTGVGGGTIIGLAKKLLGTTDINRIVKLAREGDIKKVNLTVGDIVGRPIGILGLEDTASNFGKMSDEAGEEDIAAGILCMVGEVIGMLVAMAAGATGLTNRVVLVGKLSQTRLVSEKVKKICEKCGVKAIVPEKGEYCTAIGAAVKVKRVRETF